RNVPANAGRSARFMVHRPLRRACAFRLHFLHQGGSGVNGSERHLAPSCSSCNPVKNTRPSHPSPLDLVHHGGDLVRAIHSTRTFSTLSNLLKALSAVNKGRLRCIAVAATSASANFSPCRRRTKAAKCLMA